MTVAQLIDRLEILLESELINEGTEVRMAYQPHYPLESHIAQCISRKELVENEIENRMNETGCDRDEAEAHFVNNYGPEHVEEQDVVYLAEGAQVGYGLRGCWS
jgi:hypothetical protein